MDSTPAVGERKRTLPPVIGTHDGTFHCDEVAACFMLKQLPEYSMADIVRSRDPAKWKECDILVDVGAEYNTSTHRYDHHQREFKETFHSLRPDKPWTIKLSSAGLVYLHFGERILAHLTKLPVDSKILQKIYDKMYENFILEIDAIDNGVSVCEGQEKYRIHSQLSSRVGYLNPWWNQTEISTDERFHAAMQLVGKEFLDRLHYYEHCWLPARQVVETAWLDRKTNPFLADFHGRVMILPESGCPWKEHLFDLEQSEEESGEKKWQKVLFVLYSDASSAWRIQGVPPNETASFQQRMSLHVDWLGLRDEKLSAVSGIDNCIFVHTTGFIGGNKTLEGVLQMAKKTIESAC